MLAMAPSFESDRAFEKRLEGVNDELAFAKHMNDSKYKKISDITLQYQVGSGNITGIERNLEDKFPTSSIKTIGDALKIPNKIEEFESIIEEKKAERVKTLEKITSIEKTRDEIMQSSKYSN